MRNILATILLVSLVGCFKNTTPPPDRSVEISQVIEYNSLTLTNYSNSDVNLSGWKLTEVISFITTTSRDYVFQPVNLAKGASIIFTSSQLGFRLQKPDEIVYLYDQTGKLVDQMSWVSFE